MFSDMNTLELLLNKYSVMSLSSTLKPAAYQGAAHEREQIAAAAVGASGSPPNGFQLLKLRLVAGITLLPETVMASTDKQSPSGPVDMSSKYWCQFMKAEANLSLRMWAVTHRQAARPR